MVSLEASHSTRSRRHTRGHTPTQPSCCPLARLCRHWGRPCAHTSPLSRLNGPKAVGCGRCSFGSGGCGGGGAATRCPRRQRRRSPSPWRRRRCRPPLACSPPSWAGRTRCWTSGRCCRLRSREAEETRVREGWARRSTRARRALRACSWRLGPRAGRWGQRRTATGGVPSLFSTRISLLVSSGPPRRHMWPTGMVPARRPRTATSIPTRFQVSTMEACSASIDSRENVKAAPGSHADVAASICLSTPTS